jgi:hypothetical protein
MYIYLKTSKLVLLYFIIESSDFIALTKNEELIKKLFLKSSFILKKH